MKKLTSFCKVCHAPVIELNDKQFNIVYLRCSTCGFVHLDDQFHVSFDEEKEEYNLHENSADDEGYVNYLNNFLKIAVDPFINEGSMLDYGCGPGPVLAMLMNKRGFSTKTYDRHFPHDYDALEHKYDLITSTEVFEHFHDPVSEMKKICDLLNPNGILSIMTSVPPHGEAFLKWGYRRERTHISFYTRKSLEQLAKAVDMKVIFHDEKRVTVFQK